MELLSVRSNILKCIEREVTGAPVMDALMSMGGLPAEGEFWDYKHGVIDKEKDFYAKTVRSCLSFYNTYGGYLIYGVNDENDKRFTIEGCPQELVDQKKLKSAFDKYLGVRIDCDYSDHSILVSGENVNVGILRVSKRRPEVDPVPVVVDYKTSKNKVVFKKHETFFRDGDQSISALNAAHWSFINSKRFISEVAHIEPEEKKYIENNLPDRNFVCPDFLVVQILLMRCGLGLVMSLILLSCWLEKEEGGRPRLRMSSQGRFVNRR